ncbi:hypothetical protein [Deinococcus planocerae]|uniref:hypothetical protein n=1 Tax=Deinococcus planocerae TaxID=1737569 RepID=UPI000C7ED20C|nr:hypothetical protein [Deinococcus planocerae]
MAPSTEKIKVTHTLTRHTHSRVRELVQRGEVKDVSAFIEQAVEQALREHKLRNLALELEAFEDPDYAAEVARLGEEGMEDLRVELNRRG